MICYMHKVDIKQRHRMPVLFQMILASILTFLVMSLLMFGFWILQHIKENNFQILMTELESVVHLILGWAGWTPGCSPTGR